MHRNTCERTVGLLLIVTVVLLATCAGTRGEGKPEAGVARTEGKTGVKMCEEHGLPESECGICHPERAAALKPGEGSKVRLPAGDSARLVGVEMAAATVG